MNLIEINNLRDTRLAPYVLLTEAQLRNRLDPAQGVIICESPKVIRIALDLGYEPLSLLCESKHVLGDAQDIVERLGDTPIFTGPRELLQTLTGYTLTRGVLCAMRRRPQPKAENICAGATRVVVIDGVVDNTNIGAIFRSAAALGIEAVLVTPQSCDPYNRRSIRVSMGNVFLVPWAWIDKPADLKAMGFKTVAMALTDDSVPIDDPALNAEPRLAIILGTEGDGLSQEAISEADYVARIPMQNGVDSLNVAAASAVAFWQLRK